MASENDLEKLDGLLAQVSRLHYTRAHQLLERLNLYRGQPPVLHWLWKQEGITQKELAQRMNITPATLTKMLQRMEKAGFVQRRADTADQRISRVYLTEAGWAVKKEIEQIWQTMEEEVFANFSEEEKILLRRLLNQLRENLIQLTGEKPF